VHAALIRTASNSFLKLRFVHTLASRPEEALKKILREAFQKGYSTAEARREPEFRSLQNRPEFAHSLAQFSHDKK